MLTMSSGAVEIVLRQHAEGAVHLANQRTILVRGAGVGVAELRRHDRRLDAYLDGLATAGEQGRRMSDLLFESPGYGESFTAAVGAIEGSDRSRVDRLFALSHAVPPVHTGLADAFGWVAPGRLVGLIKELLGSSDTHRRTAGMAACAMHLVHSPVLQGFAGDGDAAVRACALRAAGELGRQELVPTCTEATEDPDSESQFWGTWSAVMLGARGRALHSLGELGIMAGPHRPTALQLALQAMSAGEAHHLLQRLAAESQDVRSLIRGSGVAGDPAYVPWLIRQMARPDTARTAGEAFSLITGIDLAQMGLESNQFEDFACGPNDDPDDAVVDLDADEGLTWPDAQKVEQWWAAKSNRFQKGRRYFMGAPVSRERCIDVLKNGYQRQRILAAHYLCLLEPGTPLFNTSAPAWRQQKLLAQMS